MRTRTRNRLWMPLLAVLLLALAAFLLIRYLKEEVDPHAGQVYLYDGYDWIWYTPLEGVEPNPWGEEDFRIENGQPVYQHEDFRTQRGIDVSEHQLAIDWAQVATANLDYAYVRIGRRGYTEGGLFADPYFEKNIQGAKNAGLDVGVYFFSQAITVQEAIEEARFVIDHLQGWKVELPVVFDWEKIRNPDGTEVPDARTNGLSVETRTDCAVAFCETIRSAGYTPALYFNRTLGYYGFDLTRLTDYEFWFALPEAAYPSFYYAVDSWQYSFNETVPGISGETDMNLRFIPVVTETEGEQ